jgi:hypothetical protein
MHLALRSSGAFAGVTARFASHGFIGKPFFREKFLFADREHKLLAAVFAGDGFVLISQLDTSFRKILLVLSIAFYYTRKIAVCQ